MNCPPPFGLHGRPPDPSGACCRSENAFRMKGIHSWCGGTTLENSQELSDLHCGATGGESVKVTMEKLGDMNCGVRAPESAGKIKCKWVRNWACDDESSSAGGIRLVKKWRGPRPSVPRSTWRPASSSILESRSEMQGVAITVPNLIESKHRVGVRGGCAATAMVSSRVSLLILLWYTKMLVFWWT